MSITRERLEQVEAQRKAERKSREEDWRQAALSVNRAASRERQMRRERYCWELHQTRRYRALLREAAARARTEWAAFRIASGEGRGHA